jgi:hypothetical protein
MQPSLDEQFASLVVRPSKAFFVELISSTKKTHRWALYFIGAGILRKICLLLLADDLDSSFLESGFFKAFLTFPPNYPQVEILAMALCAF